MKRILAIAALAMLPTGAFAQTAVVQIAPEQRTVIKEYVVKHKVAPAPIKERVTVGATLPADVELVPVPSEWGPTFSRYRYVYTGDDIVLVDPGTRHVVEVID